MTLFKKFFLMVLILIFAGTIAGCSGKGVFNGNSSENTVKGSSGSAAFKFAWPAQNKSKFISSGTNSFSISITGTGLDSARTTTVAYGTASITISDLPVGDKTATVSALNSLGAVLSKGITTFVVEPGKTSSVTIVLGIVISNTGFSPSSIAIDTNTLLFFYNSDTISHNLIGAAPFNNTAIPAGSSMSFQFTTAGQYICYLDDSSLGISLTIMSGSSQMQITGISPSSGSPGDTVTITGSNFGSSQGSSTVTFNGTTATSVTSWSNSQIICTVPYGAATGNAVVTVGSVASNGVAFTVNQKIIIVGDFTTYNGTARNRIARVNSDGSLDTPFAPGSGANLTVRAVAVQTDGKILIGGDFFSYNGTIRNCIARVNTDGSLDTSFNPSTGANNSIRTITVQSDGKILIGGSFTSYNGTTRNRIARVNTDGSLDTSFNPSTGANNPIDSIAVQTDGKILIGGEFTSYNSESRNCIARVNTDGSLDTSFNPGTGADNTVDSIAIQTNGKILFGGAFTTYNGTARVRIARVNSDGSLDVSFTPDAGANGEVLRITIQTDGKILIGGIFSAYNGTSRNCIARVNSDGSLDVSFDPGTGANNFAAPILQSDGKILIGGAFTTYNGTARIRVARLNSDGSLDTSCDTGLGANNTVNSAAVW